MEKKKIGPPSKRLSPSLNRKLPPNNWKEYVRLGYFFLNGMTFSSNWRTIFQCFLIPSLDASKMNEMRSGDIISNNHNVLLLKGNRLCECVYYTNLLEEKNDQHICNNVFCLRISKAKVMEWGLMKEHLLHIGLHFSCRHHLVCLREQKQILNKIIIFILKT